MKHYALKDGNGNILTFQSNSNGVQPEGYEEVTEEDITTFKASIPLPETEKEKLQKEFDKIKDIDTVIDYLKFKDGLE